MRESFGLAFRGAGKALLSARFTFENPGLVRARLHLFMDRIELTGWHLRGAYRRIIALEEILQVDVTNTNNLLLWLATGETLRLRVTHSAQWKAEIDDCLSRSRT